MGDLNDFDMSGFDMDYTDTSPESVPQDIDVGLHLDPALDFAIADLIGDAATDPANLWVLPDYSSKLDLPPLPTPPRLPIRDLAVRPAQNMCLNVDLDLMNAHDERTQLGWIVKFMSNLHVGFAKTLTLPFAHPRQFASNVPATIMSAFAAATAYVGRTPENKAWTYRLIVEAGRDIVCKGQAATTPAEKLARAQALLLINTIRVFSGDVTLKSQADKEMPLLLTWLQEIQPLGAELVGGGEAADRTSKDMPPTSWDVSRRLFHQCPFGWLE
jgi:hypothetical protein